MTCDVVGAYDVNRCRRLLETLRLSYEGDQTCSGVRMQDRRPSLTPVPSGKFRPDQKVNARTGRYLGTALEQVCITPDRCAVERLRCAGGGGRINSLHPRFPRPPLLTALWRSP